MTAAAFTIRVPGSTSNLGHGFDCLGMAVAIHNRISVTTTSDDRISCPEAADPGLAAMARRVREACARAWRQPVPGLEIRVAGEVPMSRGLGSSATVLLGLGAACQLACERPLDRDELVRLGTEWEGHPDNVAASCLGGFTAAGDTSVGLVYQRQPVPADLVGVVAIPDHSQRTDAARGVLPGQLSREEAVIGWQRSALIVAAIAAGNLDGLRHCFADAWHERYRASMNPGLQRARDAAEGAGALGCFLSGSGSTVLALSRPSEQTAVAAAMSSAYRDLAIACDVRAVHFDNDGLTVLDQA